MIDKDLTSMFNLFTASKYRTFFNALRASKIYFGNVVDTFQSFKIWIERVQIWGSGAVKRA